MEKVNIVGKDPEKIEKMKKELESAGFEYVEANPDLVISYGGDGMFLISERIFPGVPKVLIRDSDVGNKCCNLNILDVVKLYLKGDYKVEEIRKLKAIHRGRFEVRRLIGVNDMVLRNSLPTEAIRFRYRINGKEWSDVFIGDGVVVSTAYGSSKGAYFYSITKKKFKKGIGVAFNNTANPHKSLLLSEGDYIEIKIERGIGVLVSDNNRDYINLEAGDVVKVKMIEDVARRIVLNECKIKD